MAAERGDKGKSEEELNFECIDLTIKLTKLWIKHSEITAYLRKRLRELRSFIKEEVIF